MITIAKTFRFEASHVLPRHPGKCSRLHGHSWELKVAVRGWVNHDTGFVMDYNDLKQLVQDAIIDKVDHQHLGMDDLESAYTRLKSYLVPTILPKDFYPSSENLVVLFADILNARLDALIRLEGQPSVMLAYVKLKETCTSEAVWTPK